MCSLFLAGFRGGLGGGGFGRLFSRGFVLLAIVAGFRADVNIIAGQVGAQAHILALVANGKAQLLVRHGHATGAGLAGQKLDLDHLGGAEGSGDELGDILAPLNDVDLLTAQLLDHSSHTVTVGPNGQYRTIQAALDANDSSETDRLVLKITPGDYREKITVTKPGVTFANADVTAKRAVTIRASYYSSNTFDADGKFVPQDEFDLGTNKCATVTIGAGATGFSAYGITFQNDYNVVDHTAAGEQTPAVALNTQADKVYLKNSRIIGRQDTLYVQGAGNRVYVDGGYIEGTVDFVFGDANAYFAGTELHMAAFAGKNNGYFTAANTKKSGVGLVFDRCNLTVAAAYDDDAKLSLGRPWQTFAQYTQVRKGDGSSYVTGVDLGTKNSAYTDTSSAVTYLDSTMSSKITKNRWNVWTSKNQSGKSVDVTFHDDVRFAEYASHDETGALLDPADYKNVVLGSMSALDEAQVQAKRAELLAALGFGSAAGQWVVPDGAWPFAYDPNYSTGTDVQPTQPGGNASPNADSAAKADTMPETGSAIIAVVVVAVPLLVAGLALVAVRRNRQQ